MHTKSYAGPERRRHLTYLTRNTEYHLRDGICVAVRNRRNNHWLLQHKALSQKLAGGVRFHPDGVAIPVDGGPQIGEALYFEEAGRGLVTSLVCAMERPTKQVVSQYAAVGVG
ncbi:MAG: hypothetical protein SFV15_02825 [Polyangiaceae bacterium]|nr:hypothetical protein [Polyangiaceae bacterium]